MFINDAKVRVCLSAYWSPSIDLSAHRKVPFEALTDPNQQRHKMPIDSPKNGIAFVFVILYPFEMGSSTQIKNISVSLNVFVT